VPVAAELAQQGLRVPEHQVWLVRPRQRRVGGEQRTRLQALAGGLGGTPRQLRRLDDRRATRNRLVRGGIRPVRGLSRPILAADGRRTARRTFAVHRLEGAAQGRVGGLEYPRRGRPLPGGGQRATDQRGSAATGPSAADRDAK
jgi:hypothetical protein